MCCFCFGVCGRGFLVMQTDLEFSDLPVHVMTAWPKNRWMTKQSHPSILSPVNRNALSASVSLNLSAVNETQSVQAHRHKGVEWGKPFYSAINKNFTHKKEVVFVFLLQIAVLQVFLYRGVTWLWFWSKTVTVS